MLTWKPNYLLITKVIVLFKILNIELLVIEFLEIKVKVIPLLLLIIELLVIKDKVILLVNKVKVTLPLIIELLVIKDKVIPLVNKVILLSIELVLVIRVRDILPLLLIINQKLLKLILLKPKLKPEHITLPLITE